MRTKTNGIGLAALAGAATAALMMTGPALAGPAQVAVLDIEGALSDRPDPFAWFTGEMSPTLLDMVMSLHDAAGDPDVDGVVIRLKDAALGLSQVDELGSAMEAFREAGKEIVVFSEAYAPSGLLLGAHADHVVLQQGGYVSMPGLYMEEMFLADTLSWAGLDASFVQIGDYKGANEQMTRSGPSDAWDENISGLLDSMYSHLRTGIMSGRDLSGDELDQAMGELWLAPGHVAERFDIIDDEADFADLWGGDALAGVFGGAIEYAGELGGGGGMGIDTSNPFALFTMLMEGPTTQTSGPTIAVLHLDGPIVDGESSPGGAFGGSSVGSRTLRNSMAEIARDDNVKGVVMRIDSPGGSASASEMIWEGLRRLSEDKPVWVSVGSMAASGGYYSAVGGDKIYLNDGSIVGSIGVVGGKITMGELLDRGKVNIVERTRGPRGGMMSMTNEWTAGERALVQRRMLDIYLQFAQRVQQGRPGADLDEIGEGRLFLGEDAVALDMADELGGLMDAIGDLASELDMSDYDVMHYPGPQSFEDLLESTLGGFVRSREASADGTLP
ncbi:MAG: S49 family peptidase, partial [Planctomycetota bacterium]